MALHPIKGAQYLLPFLFSASLLYCTSTKKDYANLSSGESPNCSEMSRLTDDCLEEVGKKLNTMDLAHYLMSQKKLWPKAGFLVKNQIPPHIIAQIEQMNYSPSERSTAYVKSFVKAFSGLINDNVRTKSLLRECSKPFTEMGTDLLVAFPPGQLNILGFYDTLQVGQPREIARYIFPNADIRITGMVEWGKDRLAVWAEGATSTLYILSLNRSSKTVVVEYSSNHHFPQSIITMAVAPTGELVVFTTEGINGGGLEFSMVRFKRDGETIRRTVTGRIPTYPVRFSSTAFELNDKIIALLSDRDTRPTVSWLSSNAYNAFTQSDARHFVLKLSENEFLAEQILEPSDYRKKDTFVKKFVVKDQCAPTITQSTILAQIGGVSAVKAFGSLALILDSYRNWRVFDFKSSNFPTITHKDRDIGVKYTLDYGRVAFMRSGQLLHNQFNKKDYSSPCSLVIREIWTAESGRN